MCFFRFHKVGRSTFAPPNEKSQKTLDTMKAENKFRLLGCVVLASLLSYAILTGPTSENSLDENPSAIELNIDGVEV